MSPIGATFALVMAYIERRTTGRGEKRWRVCWRENGRRESMTFTSSEKAKTFRGRVEAAGERWPDDATPADVPTITAWATRFLETRTGIADRTRADYERDLKRHVLPTFGEQFVDEPGHEDVRRWVRGLEQRKLKPKTIANLHGLLAAMFREAVRAQLRPDNPCDGTRLPRADRAGDDLCALTPTEFALLRECIEEDSRDLLTVLVGTGMRWSEATALEVRYVNLDETPARLSVVQAWKRQPDGSIKLGPPKTRRGRRVITLDAVTVAALKRHIDGKEPGELAFRAYAGGPLLHGNFTWRRWHPAVKAAQKKGLTKRPRIHDLRHTHASWLVAAGVPLPAVQRRLGHESIQTTVDRYSHLAPDVDYGVTAALDAALVLSASPTRVEP